MSERYAKIGYLTAFVSGLICWYFGILNVTHPVIHPLFGHQYNTLIFAVFDNAVADFDFLLWMKFSEHFDDGNLF